MLLVTGITGHSGRYFLEELIKNRYEKKIRFIVRESSDTKLLDRSGLNFEKVIGDISDESFLNECMEGVDSVLHITNIRYTIGIVKSAIKNKVSRVVCVHTTGIYSKYRSAAEEYKLIERTLQDLIKNSKIKVTILRPTMIYGDLCDRNMSRFIKMIDKLRVFPLINGGKGLVQPVNARDLGKAYYSILHLPSEVIKPEYNLSGEKPISLLEAMELISTFLNKKTKFINVPLGVGVFLAQMLKIITFKKYDYVEKVQRMGENRCFSHAAALEDIGYHPESFEIGIAREVKEYLNRSR